MTPAIGRVVVYAGVLTALILLLIPFTQYITGLVDGKPDMTAIDVVPPPPPPPPDFEEPPEEPPPEEPPPEMSEPPPPVSLAQLDVALQAGVGDAMGDGFGFGGFAVQPNAVDDIMLFDVKDLDERPRPLGNPRFPTPIEAKRERISGSFRIEVAINEQGATRVLKVLAADPSRFTAEVTTWLETVRFTPPKKNGEAVSARYVVPVQWNVGR